MSQVGQVVELAVVAGDGAERGRGVDWLVREQLLDALLGLGGDLVGLLVVLLAVLDEQLREFPRAACS